MGGKPLYYFLVGTQAEVSPLGSEPVTPRMSGATQRSSFSGGIQMEVSLMCSLPKF